jgi:predicted glycosyltransferase involved in capsule biosynthesis
MLSIVIPWCNRKELRAALPGLCAAATMAQGDITIVNYTGTPALLQEYLPIEPSPIRVVEVTGPKYFNKARALNIGAYYSSGQVLFFCDCDIIVNPQDIVDLATEVQKNAGSFATLAGVRESIQNSRQAGNVVCFGYELNIRIANGRQLRIVDNEEDAKDGTRQAPGLLLVNRKDFLGVSGYNGRLHGWGWEDQDMIARLTLSAGLVRIQRHCVTHLSHDDLARMAYYPPASSRWESRDRMFRQALAFYDCADFAGTYDHDWVGLQHRRVTP